VVVQNRHRYRSPKFVEIRTDLKPEHRKNKTSGRVFKYRFGISAWVKKCPGLSVFLRLPSALAMGVPVKSED
jgi:hypothetical protein